MLPQYLISLKNEGFMSLLEQNLLISSLNAKPVLASEWERGQLFDTQISCGIIPKIANWIESNNYSNMNKALNYIRELELKDHLNLVFKCWHNKEYPRLRQEALLTIIEWKPEETGKF